MPKGLAIEISRLLLGFAQDFRLKQSLIYAMESLGHARPQQLVVEDLEQVVHDEPDGFFRGHPLQMIEAGKIYGTRKGPQSSLPSQIEIKVEIADGQLAQGAVHGLAVTAAAEVGFRHCSPVAIHAVGVVLSLEIQNQRGKAVGS